MATKIIKSFLTSVLKEEYRALSAVCRNEAVTLIDQCRTDDEIKLLLCRRTNNNNNYVDDTGNPFPTLIHAISFKQKEVCILI